MQGGRVCGCSPEHLLLALLAWGQQQVPAMYRKRLCSPATHQVDTAAAAAAATSAASEQPLVYCRLERPLQREDGGGDGAEADRWDAVRRMWGHGRAHDSFGHTTHRPIHPNPAGQAAPSRWAHPTAGPSPRTQGPPPALLYCAPHLVAVLLHYVQPPTAESVPPPPGVLILPPLPLFALLLARLALRPSSFVLLVPSAFPALVVPVVAAVAVDTDLDPVPAPVVNLIQRLELVQVGGHDAGMLEAAECKPCTPRTRTREEGVSHRRSDEQHQQLLPCQGAGRAARPPINRRRACPPSPPQKSPHQAQGAVKRDVTLVQRVGWRGHKARGTHFTPMGCITVLVHWRVAVPGAEADAGPRHACVPGRVDAAGPQQRPSGTHLADMAASVRYCWLSWLLPWISTVLTATGRPFHVPVRACVRVRVVRQRERRGG